MLLILILVLAIIIKLITSQNREQFKPCTGLSKTDCTKDFAQKALCDYDPTRCQSCMRRKCEDIKTKSACKYTNRAYDYINTSTTDTVPDVVVKKNKYCPDQNKTDEDKGYVKVPKKDRLKCVKCKNGLEFDPDTGNCEPKDLTQMPEALFTTKDDGSYGINKIYLPSCNLLGDDKTQPFIPQDHDYIDPEDTTKTATGTECVKNTDVTTTYECPKNYYSKLSDSPPTGGNNRTTNLNYNPTVGTCVPKKNYVLITKPKADKKKDQKCGNKDATDTKPAVYSGFKYDTTYGRCISESDLPTNFTYTCKPKGIAVGKNPWEWSDDEKKCVQKDNPYTVVDYQCPTGYTSSSYNEPCEPETTLDIVPDGQLNKLPCTWNKKKRKCKECKPRLTDLNSGDVFCFRNKKNKPICEHPNYRPSEQECSSVLGKHCKWNGEKCVRK